MLKLYTNKTLLTEATRSKVFPLLFDLVYQKDKKISTLYTLVDNVEDCDFCILPLDYGFMAKNEAVELSKFVKSALDNNKTIWFYSAGDYGFTNYVPNSYTFRFGGFDSLLDKSNLILPSFISDPYATYLNRPFKALKKEDKPSIGFVGHAKLGFNKWLKEAIAHTKYVLKQRLKIIFADKQSFYPSSITRATYLHKLLNNEGITANFIFRDNYRAGVLSEAQKEKTTLEFYENIYNNAYTFCLRGVGNFSVRFYETLAMGRIPILINTDCRLPLNEDINWNNHCLIINDITKEPVEEQIINFHNNLSEIEFENIQEANRKLWLNKLQRTAYFETIIPYFHT